jgi:hypothetical protein
MKARARRELPLFNPRDAKGVTWRSDAIQSFMDKYATAAGKAEFYERMRLRHRERQRRLYRERKAAGR